MLSVYTRRFLGAIALAMGLVLVFWFIYNLFRPTAEFRRSFYGPWQLLAPIAFLIYGWKWIRFEGQGIEQTPGTLKFQELDDSVLRARARLDYFISQVEKNVNGAYVKFPLQTPQGLTEHIWAYVHSFRDGKFNVSLANQPKDHRVNVQVRRNVDAGDVEDWQILESDGRLRGAYSTIALFKLRERERKPLTPKMRKQRATLMDVDS